LKRFEPVTLAEKVGAGVPSPEMTSVVPSSSSSRVISSVSLPRTNVQTPWSIVVFYRFGADFSLAYHSCKFFVGSSHHNIVSPAFAHGFHASFGEQARLQPKREPHWRETMRLDGDHGEGSSDVGGGHQEGDGR
jgi:hypothetical protein